MSYASPMPPPLSLSIAILLIIAGSVTVVCPALVSKFQEDADTSPVEAIWQI